MSRTTHTGDTEPVSGEPDEAGAPGADADYWGRGVPNAEGAPWTTGIPPSRLNRPHLPEGVGEWLGGWWPELGASIVVFWTFWVDAGAVDSAPPVPLLVGLLLAVAFFRRRPTISLAMLWLTASAHLLFGGPTRPLISEVVATGLISFGCSRFGSRGLRRLALLSIIVIIPLVLLLLNESRVQTAIDIWQTQGPGAVPWGSGLSAGYPVAVVALLVLVLPWIIGRASRTLTESRAREAEAQEQRATAERERSYAQEVADLKAGQAQLARDVHDVVGHSLAVILAQAESAQYLNDDETQQMRQTLANVAVSARRSLQDVRNVLQPARAPTAPPATGLDALIDGVATAGNDVRRHVVGTPRPLPPDLEQPAYRVLQEMLTNALKHGRRGGPVWVEQDWPDDWRAAHLRLTVRNLLDDATTAPLPAGAPRRAGLGLDSMRYRVESVGGQLVTELTEEGGGRVFTATAWLPLRSAEVSPDED